jgi:hypothetical protein
MLLSIVHLNGKGGINMNFVLMRCMKDYSFSRGNNKIIKYIDRYQNKIF